MLHSHLEIQKAGRTWVDSTYRVLTFMIGHGPQDQPSGLA